MARFPRLTTPSVFIAAPEDLDYLRKRISRDLAVLKRESGVQPRRVDRRVEGILGNVMGIA
jgi:hypothetical protein